MDKGSLKSFAIKSKKVLLEKMKNKLAVFGITSKGIKELEEKQKMGSNIEINGVLYSRKSYDSLCSRYKVLGYEQLLEESAYTWFNRLVAFAFMEINNYIDERIVFNSGDRIEPEILDNYYEFDFFQELDEESQNEINDLKEKNTADSLEKLYSILVEEKCYELSKIMPFMFEKRGSYSDILFPEGLLMKKSFLDSLRDEFRKAIEKNEDDEERVPVEIIGWLYQYYNQDKRDMIYDGSMKKEKINKEFIPPATQLFTPHWIVKYLAENSLGKLALESCGVSEEVKKSWKYYIDNEVQKNEEILKIEEIKIIDPAMGSGHMLTYCFDMLSDIYEDLGWSKKDAVLSIIRNNIYGLDIDKRAGQLASFAIFMKAREKFSRFFKVLERMEEDEKISINTLAIEESNDISESTQNLIKENGLVHLERLLADFYDAEEYGSILKLESIEIKNLYRELEELEEIYRKQGQLSLSYSSIEKTDFGKEYELIEKLIYQYKIMIDKYDIVITNPPYMGNARMNSQIKEYTDKYYPEAKSDLFSVFFIKCCEMAKINGYLGFMSPFVWMFIKSYEELRKKFINEKYIVTLTQLEYSGFEDATVPICTFVLQNSFKNEKGDYIKLSEFKGAKNQPIKTLEAIENPKCSWRYKADQKEFKKILGYPIAYWISNKVREIFENDRELKENFEIKSGIMTGNDEKFLKFWNEVEFKNIGFKLNNHSEMLKSRKKWFPLSKGGSYRKWFGNNEHIINLFDDGKDIKNSNGNYRLRESKYYLKNSITWSRITSTKVSFRNSNQILFSDAGPSIFLENNMKYMLALLNMKILEKFLSIKNPTLNFQVNDIASMPIKFINNQECIEKIDMLTQQNIDIAKEEWDSRETSWDFKKLFITNGDSIEKAYDDYCQYWSDKFMQMHHNEEELNRIFIDIYELNDEMDEKVPFEDITVRV